MEKIYLEVIILKVAQWALAQMGHPFPIRIGWRVSMWVQIPMGVCNVTIKKKVMILKKIMSQKLDFVAVWLPFHFHCSPLQKLFEEFVCLPTTSVDGY